MPGQKEVRQTKRMRKQPRKLIGSTWVLLFLLGGAAKEVRSDEYVPDLGVSLEVSGCAALHPGQAGFVGKLLTAWILLGT